MSILYENIYLPGLDYSRVVAKKDQYSYRWNIECRMDGPDDRYNSASNCIDAYSINDIIDTLWDSLEIMKSLKENNFSGTYEKDMKPSIKMGMGLVAYNSNVYLKISLSSNTYTFYKNLAPKDVYKWITTLSSAYEIGNRLINTLKSLG